jgi:hypothetical protein
MSVLPRLKLVRHNQLGRGQSYSLMEDFQVPRLVGVGDMSALPGQKEILSVLRFIGHGQSNRTTLRNPQNLACLLVASFEFERDGQVVG